MVKYDSIYFTSMSKCMLGKWVGKRIITTSMCFERNNFLWNCPKIEPISISMWWLKLLDLLSLSLDTDISNARGEWDSLSTCLFIFTFIAPIFSSLCGSLYLMLSSCFIYRLSSLYRFSLQLRIDSPPFKVIWYALYTESTNIIVC